MARGDVGGKYRAARRPAFNKPHGKFRRTFQRHDAPARMHQENRASGPLACQPLFQPPQIRVHHRLDIGIGDRGVEPLIFPHLRRHFARQRHHRARQPFGQHLGDQTFMRVIDVRVQQPDCHAVIARAGQFIGQRLDLGALKRDQHIAVGVHPFAYHIAAIARQKRRWQLKVQVILFKSAFRAHFDDVAKALRCDQRRARAPPFDQRIGGQRGAVDDLVNRAGRNARLFAHFVQTLDNRIFGRAIGRQHLGGMDLLAHFQHHIGECAANIHAKSGSGAVHLS